MLAVLRVPEKLSNSERYRALFQRLVASIIILVIFYLNPVTWLNDAVLRRVGLDIGELKLYIDGALYAAATILVAYYTYELANMMVSDILSRFPKLAQMRYVIEMTAKALSGLIAIVIVINTLAARFEALEVVGGWLASAAGNIASILATFIIAMQLGNLLANYLAGLVLRIEEFVEEGDFIEIGNMLLMVRRLGWYSVEAEDRFGNIVYVPNMSLMTKILRRAFSRISYRYVEVRFTLPYGISLEEVRRRVDLAMAATRRVVSHRLLIYELGPYAVTYELQAQPRKAMFEEQFRSIIRAALLHEFGELLSTPMIVSMRARNLAVKPSE